MPRRLRIAASVFFAVLTVALCVLWVRSCWRRDEMNVRYWPTRVFEIVSMGSRFEFVNGYPVIDWPHRFNSYTHSEWEAIQLTEQRGFSGGNTVGRPIRVTIPHYAAILVVATLATIPWLHTIPRRFSLRTMLIVTTLVAAVLGLVVAVGR